MIYGGACPNPFDNPLVLENPYPYSLNTYFLTWNPSSMLWCEFPSTQIPCWLYSDPPPLFLPIPFSPFPTVPHFKYMSSYDDIAISASHSPLQLLQISLLLHELCIAALLYCRSPYGCMSSQLLVMSPELMNEFSKVAPGLSTAALALYCFSRSPNH